MNGSLQQVLPQQSIDEILTILSPETRAVLARLADPLHPLAPLSLDGFLKHLLARAPAKLIKTRTTAELAQITSRCLTTLTTVASENDRITIDFSHGKERGALCLALDDHPFIISSIAEALSDADIKVEAFLHPIVLLNGTPIALSYIEVAAESMERVLPLIPRLRDNLLTLTRVGRDFAPMKALASTLAKTLTDATYSTNFGGIPRQELAEFLDWLNDGCFFFLGAISGERTKGIDRGTALGIWHASTPYTVQLTTEVGEDLDALSRKNLAFSIRKLRLTSRVHRHATVVHILIRPSSSNGAFSSFVGYLTSKAWAHESHEIPIVRRKVEEAITQESVVPNSHDYKYIVEVIDNMPTDEALAAPTSELINLARLALGVFSQEETRSVTTVDEMGRRALTAVALPPERYSAVAQSRIQSIIESTFDAEPFSSEIHIDSIKKRQFRLYISTPLPTKGPKPFVTETLAEAISKATLPWSETLREAAESAGTATPTDALFPDDYQAATEIPEALHDLSVMNSLSETSVIAVSLYTPTTLESTPTIALFSRNREISISLATPVLENVGLEVLSANSYECSSHQGPIYLLKLGVRPYDGEPLIDSRFNEAVAPGIAKVLCGEAANDALNLLLRKVPISIREISLLRSYCALLWQINKVSTKRTMWESLAGAPHVALQLCRIFDWKFNPTHTLSIEERQQRASLEESVLIEALRQVPDITQDRVLRALLSLVRSTIRTNFYLDTETLAVKLKAQEIEFMPHPRPLFEVFVFSPRIEGTHLRSAKVARGGIRWSERLDDYRSEVLGLMKTQKVKNVIIVPSGAKGGFIVKNLARQGEALLKGVEVGYREYITALLTIADSKDGETVMHPQGVIAHDGPDPYFVVAADKGTATFSDIANSIAQHDFQYWLGDAFASGGSAGYDHKKYGITARGAWECIKRHFRDLGINYDAAPFTVVGLGDMSGDVFGNGMIYSKNIALIAAFNHKHIFIDPKPDTERTYEERVRLFNLPRSQWSDFNPSLISKGGGVFNRFDKEISLSAEVREALSIPSDVPATIDGERLISFVLQANVDLMFNGGIGTYVKARSESHGDVNDGTNDAVRVNADEVRARVVGEGGNLGFTQRARIEFSRRGGRINTDAIDNSGGVDLSDHEVNLKLLFAPLMRSGVLPFEKRNQLLLDIAPDVVESVLKHNREQALLLSVSQLRSRSTIEQYRHLIREMHRKGYLDRNRDILPDEGELDDRRDSKDGLSRPELAVCSAAIKMWLKDEIRSSNLCIDPNLERFALTYFPPRVTEQFTKEVLNHPLRSDIIASEMVNGILPVVDISFLHSLVSMHNATVPTAIKCVLAADAILGGAHLRNELHKLDTSARSEAFTQLWLDMGVAIREASNWLLITHGATHSLQEMVNLYANVFSTLTTHSATIFTGKELARFERRVLEYHAHGVENSVATTFALYRRILPLLEMLWTARECATDIRSVASLFSQVLEELRIDELFKYESVLETAGKWEQELVVGSYQEIRRSISRITEQLVRQSLTDPAKARASLIAAPAFDAIRSTMSDLEEQSKQKRPFQVAVLPVIARQLRLFKV